MSARDELERQAETYEAAAKIIRDALRVLDAPKPTPAPSTRPVQLREPDVDAPLTAVEGN